MANKTFKVTVRFPLGQPAQQVYVEANNAPQAREFAEARYGGSACGANEVR